MPNVSPFPTVEQGKPTQAIADQKIQKETILEYLKVFGFEKSLSASEIQQFIQTALAGNLDPFKREIYIAVYGDGVNRKVSILTGYQVYLKRAERTGKLDGWRAKIDGDGGQMKAVVEIFRKDWSHSFIHEVYWEEAVQKKKDGNPTQFWAKQPRFQLRKVAMAQAFRLAFPDELGGLPYESAELPDNENATAGTRLETKPAAVEKPIIPSNTDALAGVTDEVVDDSRPFGDAAPVKTETSKTQAEPEQSFGPQDFDSENDYLEKVIQQIENLFETHSDEFTEKHQAWILDKVYKATDKAGIQKMLAYTEKVVRKALSA
jgi:phage recombination protein Bet